MIDGPPRHPITDKGKVRPQIDFNTVNLQSLRDPLVRERIPSLQDALEAWRFRNDHSLIWQRIQVLPRAHTPMEFVATVYEDLTQRGAPLLMVNHEPSFSAEENIAALAGQREQILTTLNTDQFPQILKTVTLRLPVPKGRKTLLVSGVGDFQLAKGTKRQITDELELPSSAAKNSTINPPDFDTTMHLGLIPGMIKPIIQDHLIHSTSGVVYLRLGRTSEYVIITVSPIDSMIMKTEDFERHLIGYAKAHYVGFEHTRGSEFDIWKPNPLQKW